VCVIMQLLACHDQGCTSACIQSIRLSTHLLLQLLLAPIFELSLMLLLLCVHAAPPCRLLCGTCVAWV
jgi:hypothetical protein